MILSTVQWHSRYLQQAGWTRNIRAYLYSKIAITSVSRVLDIGCGTGVLEKEIYSEFHVSPFGIDIDKDNLGFAQEYASNALYLQGDCLELPIAGGFFDVTFCHFVLLWMKDISKALNEMTRVTRHGGHVLALAEPDYGGRIDYPHELAVIGKWQAEALEYQGANTNIGRQLRSLFQQAGLSGIEIGVLGGQWNENTSGQGLEQEWAVIEADLSMNEDFNKQLDQLRTMYFDASDKSQRIVFVPTFYAVGTVVR